MNLSSSSVCASKSIQIGKLFAFKDTIRYLILMFHTVMVLPSNKQGVEYREELQVFPQNKEEGRARPMKPMQQKKRIYMEHTTIQHSNAIGFPKSNWFCKKDYLTSRIQYFFFFQKLILKMNTTLKSLPTTYKDFPSFHYNCILSQIIITVIPQTTIWTEEHQSDSNTSMKKIQTTSTNCTNRM